MIDGRQGNTRANPSMPYFSFHFHPFVPLDSHKRRCFTFFIPCRPQIFSSTGRSSSASNDNALVEDCYSSWSPPSSSSTYLDLIFQRMDPQALGALMSAGTCQFRLGACFDGWKVSGIWSAVWLLADSAE